MHLNSAAAVRLLVSELKASPPDRRNVHEAKDVDEQMHLGIGEMNLFSEEYV